MSLDAIRLPTELTTEGFLGGRVHDDSQIVASVERLAERYRTLAFQVAEELGALYSMSGSGSVDCVAEKDSERRALTSLLGSTLEDEQMFATTAAQLRETARGGHRDAQEPCLKSIENELKVICGSSDPASDYTCGVCLDDMSDSEAKRSGVTGGCSELRCGHTFHTECISQWLMACSTTCPLCRSVIVM
eukprot:TRINITY_DN50981_c0_g1_i2.p1 TRINITY_DN50981_c0_g1~~TRINITY_DN50981_c0_g1_i2.p1  ORF type:complete len:213 (-),score=23.35 TRINITY_DN50981_c0_g1_i2:45-614(-)